VGGHLQQPKQAAGTPGHLGSKEAAEAAAEPNKTRVKPKRGDDLARERSREKGNGKRKSWWGEKKKKEIRSGLEKRKSNN
jgi:hypothetical protein